MKITDVPAAIEEFKREHGKIEPLEPRLIGFSWVIGIQRGNVVLVRKYPLPEEDLYEFSLMTMENYNLITKKE